MKPVDEQPTRVGYIRAEVPVSEVQAQETPSDSLPEKVRDGRTLAVGKSTSQASSNESKKADADPLLGKSVGNYRIESIIASGGMGTVYRAKQLHPVRRDVALKMIKGGLADQSALNRFHVERQALALMDHPDIARVYEADSTETGNPYFAMEFCDGLPIDQYCDTKQLGIQERIELVVRIARAASRAHSHGVVHRDLKPGNVIVSDCEGRPNLKVIDFGIAKISDEYDRHQSRDATRVGEVIGTPDYMSPEQAAGSQIDGRTDVFAIGAILFKLITGTTPIQWADCRPRNQSQYQSEVLPLSVAEIISAIQAFDPVPLSRRWSSLDATLKKQQASQLGGLRVNTVARTLKGDLDWITLRAIEPNRMQRYATADDLADDLERYLRHEAVVAVAPSLAYRLRKLYQRRRAVVLSSAAVLATLVVTGSILSYKWFTEIRKQSADLASTTAEVQRLVAEAESARKIAAVGGPTAESDFVAAQTSIAQAVTVIHRSSQVKSPQLELLTVRLQTTQSKIAMDRDARELVKSLEKAREGVVEDFESTAGDAYGRQASRIRVAKAFADFGIVVAETAPIFAAQKLSQCPQSLHEVVIETLNFMLTENPVGAGLFLSQSGGRLTVAEVVYGGGSASAGQIRVGDRLLGIGEIDLLEQFSSTEIGSQAYRLLSSPPGFKLTLRFARTPSDVRQCEVVCGGREARWAYEVLRSLDPDPWRMQLRTAIIKSDVQTVKQLARGDTSNQTPAGLLQLANALVLWERSNESIRFMETIQQRYPSNFWINQLLGNAMIASYSPPRPEASLPYLTAAVALRPESVGARMSMARTLAAMGETQKAQEQEQLARRLTPKFDPFTQLDKASTPLDFPPVDSKPLEEKQVAKKLSESESTGHLSSLEEQCRDLARSGKRAEALRLISAAESGKAENGTTVDAMLIGRAKGIVLVELRDYIAAKVLFSELVRLNPDDSISRYYFAVVLHELGDDTQAIDQCEAVLKADPNFAPARELLNVLLLS